MQEVLFVVLDNYAEHEPAFLASAITCDGPILREHPKYANKVVGPTLEPVRSCGGFRTLPDYSFENMPSDYAALILVGGYGWAHDEVAGKVVPIVQNAIGKGIIVGAICNAASFLAKHGFLNGIRHTGNGMDQLKLWGGARYTNEAGYVNVQAVSDGKIVTANGSGYLEFARELLTLLDVDPKEKIEGFYQFHKVGFAELTK